MAVSMRDVAVRAKVSVATVSKCLRSLPTIPASTREAVVAIARQMGYRPHPYVSALMQSRRKKQGATKYRPALAYVTAFPTRDGWQQETFFKNLYSGACRRAEERGYLMRPFWLYRDGMTNQRFSRVLKARGIRGLLFNPLPGSDLRLDLTWDYFSIVAHGINRAQPVFDRTSNDHHQSMMLVMKKCRELGYKRPALALAKTVSERLEQRLEAAFLAARDTMDFQAAIRPFLFAQRDLGQICTWVKSENADVLITLAHEEEIAEFRKRDMRVPADLGLISLSVDRLNSPLSGIFQNAHLMGAVATDRLIDMVERNDTGVPKDPLTLVFEGQWNQGETVRQQ